MHTHDEHCGCGHEHHTHDEHCGCGHDHHEHDEHCGRGHDHHHHEHLEIPRVEGLSIIQQNMLLGLYERHYLPVAKFVLGKRAQPDAQATALEPVYIGTPQDTMDQVKALGAELQALEDMGFLTLDYDLPLGGYAYTEYKESELYAYFLSTVGEADGREDFYFDTADMELGSMALTDAGEASVRDMLAKAE